ncbi:DUF2493 domain-containing protein [Caulobacter hibisci]|uniref:DUF2493 domain-containing protein n=1 Tax=Caulobacter hibisci TaxID=2035993 RepID=A0ABS0SXW6_9CAUL|nr:DUF2493 domain-containing protein [Caulobacter hibisci]MBI1684269.1 DUF2493 domain-containing protein [Caulobacter hibisci]
MSVPSPTPLTGPMSALEAQALTLDDPRPHPPEDALAQLGHVLMTEVLDLLTETALEDFQATIAETLIGAFHSAAMRIERDADRARDELRRQADDFDGSEIGDVDLQAAALRARAADVATLSVEMVRDAAAQTYHVATGESWKPWRGNIRASRLTAAQVEAKDVLRAAKARRHQLVSPGATVVAFRAAPQANTQVDGGRIFDALNWARQSWPDMVLATTGAEGGEQRAIDWAKSHHVAVVLARPDFDRYGRRAIFVCNDQMLALDPVCVLTLPNSLDPLGRGERGDFGPALNLGQKAAEKGVRHLAVRLRG